MQGSKSLHLALACIALSLLAGFYIWMGLVNSYSGNISDSHYYLLLADFFAHGVDIAPGIESYVAQNTHFPPGFPFVLSIFGGGAENIERAHVINNSLYLMGFIAFFYWLQNKGLKTLVSLALTLIVALNHVQLLYLVDILSESQFFLFSVLIIILLENAKSRERLLLASAVIGIGILSRSIAIAFLLPLIVQIIRFPTNRFSKGFIFFLALLPALSWKFLEHTYLSSPYVSRTDYLGYLKAAYVAAPIETITITLNSNFTALIQSWSSYTSGLPSVIHLAVASVLGLAIFICWIIRLRRLDSLALYLFAYFGIVMVWPYPLHMERFMLPVFPFLLAILVLDSGKWLVEKKKTVQFALTGLIVIIFLPAAVSMTQHIRIEPEEQYKKFRMTSEWLTRSSVEEGNNNLKLMHIRHLAIDAVSQHIGEDDCVYALQPSSIMVATRKMSILLLRHHQDLVDFNPNNLTTCKYVFMVAGMRLQFGAPDLFPYEVMREQLVPVFISERKYNGQDVLVVMLAEIVREDGKDKTEQVERLDSDV